MPSGKTVKLILYELLQFAALIVPVFVIMERFARLIGDVNGKDQTSYWLVVAIAIAYLATVTLLVWCPLKYLVVKQRRFISEISKWRPTALAYVILCTCPCFVILMISAQVQMDGGHRVDHFAELPVSLVLFSLICVDIIERIRPCRLRGQTDSQGPDIDMSGPVLTRLDQVCTITGQLPSDGGQNGLTHSQPDVSNGSTSNRWQDPASSPANSTLNSRAPSTAYLYSSYSRPRSYSGPVGFLWRRDMRAEVIVDCFTFWLDTVEMVRVAGEPRVFYSGWVFPVYVLAFVSTLRMTMAPNNPLSFAGVAMQDIPFLVIRVALIIVFGDVTPLLYPIKNVLVSLTFIYFTFLTKLKIFKRHTMF